MRRGNGWHAAEVWSIGRGSPGRRRALALVHVEPRDLVGDRPVSGASGAGAGCRRLRPVTLPACPGAASARQLAAERKPAGDDDHARLVLPIRRLMDHVDDRGGSGCTGIGAPERARLLRRLCTVEMNTTQHTHTHGSSAAVLGMRSTESRRRSCLPASRSAACLASTASSSCTALARAGTTSQRVPLKFRVDGSASPSRSGRTCICHARSRSHPD
jgi:hypothetical protein